jgi:REP-associated tyrosine transposase
MPARLTRCYGGGDLHFITFSCYRRLPLLKSTCARDMFVRELGRVCDELGFLLIGYVIMPEHVHLLVDEPDAGTPSTVLHKLKFRVSKKMRWPSATGETLRAFWQARFYDFTVYSNYKTNEKLNYMHTNPVGRGLVSQPGEWPWSIGLSTTVRGRG